jgi:hypothetical protein
MIKNKEAEAPILVLNNQSMATGYHRGSKLIKDDKSLIEELTTTNLEYKKVNLFLINEIEVLRKENLFLKNELCKHVKSADPNAVNSGNSIKPSEQEKDYTVDLTRYVFSDNDSDSDDSIKGNRPPLEFTVDS